MARDGLNDTWKKLLEKIQDYLQLSMLCRWDCMHDSVEMVTSVSCQCCDVKAHADPSRQKAPFPCTRLDTRKPS